MTNAIATTNTNEITAQASQYAYQQITALVTDSLTSEYSRVMYAHALNDFWAWYDGNGRPALTKAVVNRYKVHLQAQDFAPSTINQRLSAIRKFASEASDNGLMPNDIAQGIAKVEGVRTAGVRTGNWLTSSQAQDLLDAPDVSTLKGVRDRAILALMLGGGFRRSEVAGLDFDNIQQRDGRWVVVNLLGKGNRVRSVPIPSWTKHAIDVWASQAGISSGRVFRSINRGGNLSGGSMTSQAVQDVVKLYAKAVGFDISAHDLRRTFAKLSSRGGADIQQIQFSLGHASIKTTEIYLGEFQDITNAPCDALSLRLSNA